MRLRRTDLIDPALLPLAEASRAFYADRPARRGPANADELRAVRAAFGEPTPSDPPAQEENIGLGDHQLAVRIHEPAGRPTGAVLQLHGGGFYMGSAADVDVRNRELADSLGAVVVSVDYRLAPEHPWPAAPDDCETAAIWLTEQAERRWGVDRLAILGFSAGATLVMTTMLRLRRRGIEGFAAAVFQFGTYDLSAQTPAGRLIADEYFLDAYAGALLDRTAPDFSPIFADLSGLPATLIVVGDVDILLEDNLAMAARLVAADVDVDLRIYPEAPHGFTSHPTPMGGRALQDIEQWLATRFASDLLT